MLPIPLTQSESQLPSYANVERNGVIMSVKFIPLVLILALALGAGGCRKAKEAVMQKAAEKMMEKAIEKDGGKAKVDLANSKMSIEAKDGTKMEVASGEKGLEVPKDFPADIFIYPGTKVMTAVNAKDARSLTLSTADAVAKVTPVYQEKMKAAGWEEKQAMINPEMTMLSYEKAKQAVMVHITPDNKGAMIALIIQPKPAQ